MDAHCERCGGLLSAEARARGARLHATGRCAERRTLAARGARRITLYLDDETVGRIDAARGTRSRSEEIRRRYRR